MKALLLLTLLIAAVLTLSACGIPHPDRPTKLPPGTKVGDVIVCRGTDWIDWISESPSTYTVSGVTADGTSFSYLRSYSHYDMVKTYQQWVFADQFASITLASIPAP